MVRARAQMEQAFEHGDLRAYIASFWSLRDACYRCAHRPRLSRALEDQRIRVERYILFLCEDATAFGNLRHGPDTLLEACRARDGDAAEAATRDALLWVLAELQLLLGEHTPATLGNFVIGPNHVLPTGGWARTGSALSVFDFMKRTSIAYVTSAAYPELARHARALATYEGFEAHANAVSPTRERLLKR